jgi:hypothetical protein
MPAGERQEDGTWPEGTVNDLVDRRLRKMAEDIAKFARPEEKNTKD